MSNSWLPSKSHIPPSSYCLQTLLSTEWPGIELIPEDRCVSAHCPVLYLCRGWRTRLTGRSILHVIKVSTRGWYPKGNMTTRPSFERDTGADRGTSYSAGPQGGFWY